jgi:hypothetical protein
MILTGDNRRTENSLSGCHVHMPRTEHEVTLSEAGEYLWTCVATLLQLDALMKRAQCERSL